jgi:hypothetical protein
MHLPAAVDSSLCVLMHLSMISYYICELIKVQEPFTCARTVVLCYRGLLSPNRFVEIRSFSVQLSQF